MLKPAQKVELIEKLLLSLGKAENEMEKLWVREADGRIEVYQKGKSSDALLERITFNPKVMVGKPVIKGTRLTVEYIIKLLANGATKVEILEEYPGLTEEDILACLLFAVQSLESTSFVPNTEIDL